MRKGSFAITLGTLVVLTTPAVAAESIVGRWGESRDVCSSGAAIDIAPMKLSSEETVCEFTDVARAGDVVTWKGTCFVHGEKPRKETVVAGLGADRVLTIRFRTSGAEIAGLSRCK